MATTDPVSDDLWEALQPLLPPEPRQDRGGPARVSHRAALGGILYILRHGLRWGDLPLALGFGSGVACWRRLRQWQERGVWQAVHRVVLDWPGDLDAIDWSRASLDSISVRAKRGGEHTGPSPTDRGTAGSKYHLLVDRRGVPLAVHLSAANVHDSKVLEPLVDAVQPIRRPTGEPGRPRKRPAKLHADKGYDYPRSAAHFAAGASPRGSPGAAWTRASGWGGTGGWSSDRWHGWSPSASSRSATTGRRLGAGLAAPRVQPDLSALPSPRRDRCPLK